MSMTLAQDSLIADMARSRILLTRRISIAVSGRWGMNRSALDPPRSRSITG